MSAFIASYKKYTLRFKKPAGTSRGILRTKDTFFLCLSDKEDLARLGIGECNPLAGLSIDARPDFEAEVAGACHLLNLGCSPADLDLAGFPALACGLEMAFLDWQNGGARQLFPTDFSHGRRAIPTHGLIWMADRAGMLQQVHAKVAQGFTCIKLKVGALAFQEERDLIADIRRAYPPDQIELRLDANGAFTPENVLERLTELAPYDIFAIEQPLKPGQREEMAALCEHSPIDIALDEELIGLKTVADKRSLLETIKPRYLVLKPSLLGGFTPTGEWITLARELGLGWWVNSMLESNIGLNAMCQWVSSLETTLTPGLGTGQLYTNNIPSPLRLIGSGLIYDQDRTWNLSAIVE